MKKMHTSTKVCNGYFYPYRQKGKIENLIGDFLTDNTRLFPFATSRCSDFVFSPAVKS